MAAVPTRLSAVSNAEFAEVLRVDRHLAVWFGQLDARHLRQISTRYAGGHHQHTATQFALLGDHMVVLAGPLHAFHRAVEHDG
jgi:hypothetical protein